LAQARAAPLVERRRAAARDRHRDRGAAAQAVIGEGGLLAGLSRVGDADEAVQGIPGVVALPVGSKVAVGVVGEGLAGEARYIVDTVVPRRLVGCGPALKQRVVPARSEM
jgi:hypothetical protein